MLCCEGWLGWFSVGVAVCTASCFVCWINERGNREVREGKEALEEKVLYVNVGYASF